MNGTYGEKFIFRLERSLGQTTEITFMDGMTIDVVVGGFATFLRAIGFSEERLIAHGVSLNSRGA